MTAPVRVDSRAMGDLKAAAAGETPDAYQRAISSDDAREGRAAFAEKRDPGWEGR